MRVLSRLRAPNAAYLAVGCLGAAVSLISSGGCQKLPAHPKSYAVHGKVTSADGAPVRGGAVLFVPKERGPGGLEATAIIGADGSYQGRTFTDQEGMVPGDYSVHLEPYNVGMHGKLEGEPSKIPEKYWKAETSGLKCTVEAKDNEYNIKLE